MAEINPYDIDSAYRDFNIYLVRGMRKDGRIVSYILKLHSSINPLEHIRRSFLPSDPTGLEMDSVSYESIWSISTGNLIGI